MELVWGIGHSVWKMDGYTTPVKYPMLVQGCSITLNELTLELEIRPRDIDPKLEVDCYAEMEIPGVLQLEAFWKKVVETSGILLELGFDDTAPNQPVTISSWALDFAMARGLDVFDNRALDVPCYNPTHTFVEKLQTISTKYRRLSESQQFPANFLRHYYDVYCLLELPEVQEFMQTPEYRTRKSERFRSADELTIENNPAFTLGDKNQRTLFAKEYAKSAALYYQGQPEFDEILSRIEQNLKLM